MALYPVSYFTRLVSHTRRVWIYLLWRRPNPRYIDSILFFLFYFILYLEEQRLTSIGVGPIHLIQYPFFYIQYHIPLYLQVWWSYIISYSTYNFPSFYTWQSKGSPPVVSALSTFLAAAADYFRHGCRLRPTYHHHHHHHHHHHNHHHHHHHNYLHCGWNDLVMVLVYQL